MKFLALSAILFAAFPLCSARADGSSAYLYIFCEAASPDGTSIDLSHFSKGRGWHLFESSWDNEGGESLEMQKIRYKRTVRGRSGEEVTIAISGAKSDFQLAVGDKKAKVAIDSHGSGTKPIRLESNGVVAKCLIKEGGAG